MLKFEEQRTQYANVEPLELSLITPLKSIAHYLLKCVSHLNVFGYLDLGTLLLSEDNIQYSI